MRIYKLWIIVAVLLAIIGIKSIDTENLEFKESEEKESLIQKIHSFKEEFNTLETKEDLQRYFNSLFKDSEIKIENEEDVKEENIKGLEKVHLLYVIDGDTLYVKNNDGQEFKVRLIGIDTPESVHVDEERNSKEGELASRHTKELLESTDALYLEYDIEKEDEYGRTLAYVWFSTDTSDMENMLNIKIVKEGYAVSKVFFPNTKYADIISNHEEEAKDNQNGLWGNK